MLSKEKVLDSHSLIYWAYTMPGAGDNNVNKVDSVSAFMALALPWERKQVKVAFWHEWDVPSDENTAGKDSWRWGCGSDPR